MKTWFSLPFTVDGVYNSRRIWSDDILPRQRVHCALRPKILEKIQFTIEDT